MSTLRKTIQPKEKTAHDQLLRVYQLFQVAEARRQEAENALMLYLKAMIRADEQTEARVAQLFDMVATQRSINGDDDPKMFHVEQPVEGQAV